MSEFSRRDVLKAMGATALSTATGGLLQPRPAQAAGLSYKPETGAQLRVLRWKRFVQGDEDQWMANTRKFTQLTGVTVRVDSENFEDIRPKAAVAASVGSGPDIVLGWYDDPHQYADKLLELDELANYLDGKYGGWYDVCRRYCMHDGHWIAIGGGFLGGCLVYRRSMLKAVGYEKPPATTDGFLKLCQALKAKGTPVGFALGNAVGDANAWTHWALWAFGGRLVDEGNQVVINSKETAAALDYARALYQTFIPGTLSWLDPNNNKAFLAGDISLTLNGVSVYYVAKTSKEEAVRKLAADIHHVNMPVGPTGKAAELNPFTPMFVFKYTKYPNAAREYLRFMMEREQYEAWQAASLGYVQQPLKAYADTKFWKSDPKLLPYRNVPALTRDNGYAGRLGASSAGAMADYIVVNMFAQAASGASGIEAAMKQAESRARRYYR
ncbi:MAG TPA: extracellular solute-binding protein [Burkholderiales bacterium]|nr:extracellular solute-binding protein [Burkholderiales bacterium]